MTKRSMPCLFHATLYALGTARLRMLNLLRSVDPLSIRGRLFLVGFSCLNLKHSVWSKRIYGEGLIKNHYRHREVIMEEQTFRQAVEDHRDVVFRIALTYLRDRADADDVAQDVFLKLLKSDAQFESWEHLRRWLIRVTINECKSLFRKPWRRVEDIENLADSLSTAQEETKAVLSDVMRLPERFRIPIVLYYYLGFSTSEIAELLHVPAATVRTRLARGRSKLKFILEEGDREIQPDQAGLRVRPSR